MNRRAIAAIVRKDIRVALQSKAVTLPLIIVPLVIVIAMPLLVTFIVRFAGGAAMSAQDMQELRAMMPPELMEQFAGLTEEQSGLVFLSVYLFAPLYLLLPLMTSNVIAADSFAGEKERKTLEALVYTPTTDGELFAAKVLAAWLPGLAVGFGSALVYTVLLDVLASPVLGGPVLPNALWLVVVLWVGPAVALMGLAASVLASARVSTFQEAYQTGSMVVLPIVALVIGQVTGVIYFNLWFAIGLGAFVWALDGLLLWFGMRTLRRSELVARL